MINYHNHTPLCGHATGEISEYIEKAIELGIREMGFSDHAPMPEGLREGISMKPEEAEVYIGNVLAEKDKYEGKLDVRLGFEVDFPLFDTFNRDYFSDPRIDYLIGSCHFIDGWPFDHPDYIDEFSRRDVDEIYLRYYEIMGELVDSGLFDIVGHMDLVKKFGHRAKSDLSGKVRELSRKISKRGMAAEINTSGLLKPVGEIYPSREIVEIFFQENVPITLGSDSHSPESVGYGYESALEMVKSVGYRKLSGFRKRERYEMDI